jgi:large subunit ribosomal protein L24
MKIKVGDKVKVVAGKDRIRGHEGTVIRVLPERNRVIVEGAGRVKRHQRAVRQNDKAGIIDKDMPIHVSNVMIVCKSCGPTRIGYRFVERKGDTGAMRKVRVCRKCDTVLEND